MRYAQRKLLAAVLAVLVPLVGLADPGPSLDENRQALEKWRQDPQHAARLKRNQAYFRRLPPDVQDRLRKLDRDLSEEGPAMRARLRGVMERYSAWLDSLTEEQRKSIETAPNRKARLERIRELRQEQWAKQLPKAKQDQLAKVKGKERAELIHKFWQEDLEHRADWQVAERNWRQMVDKPQQLPTNYATLPRDMQIYYDKSLKPLLTAEEEKRLKDAEGKWPRYTRVLVELADLHPLSVLGPIGPTRIDELKTRERKLVDSPKEKGLRDRLTAAEGKWPDFGVVMREDSKKGGEKRHLELPARFTPAHPRDFSPAVQQFIERRLLPALSDDERNSLTETEGKWPAYPKLLVKLAREHNLPVPTDPLPGAAEWDRYRTRSLGVAEGR